MYPCPCLLILVLYNHSSHACLVQAKKDEWYESVQSFVAENRSQATEPLVTTTPRDVSRQVKASQLHATAAVEHPTQAHNTNKMCTPHGEVPSTIKSCLSPALGIKAKNEVVTLQFVKNDQQRYQMGTYFLHLL